MQFHCALLPTCLMLWAALQPQLELKVVRLKLGTCNEELSISAGTADWFMQPCLERAGPATTWVHLEARRIAAVMQHLTFWSLAAQSHEGRVTWCGASVSTSQGQHCCKPDAATRERHQLLAGQQQHRPVQGCCTRHLAASLLVDDSLGCCAVEDVRACGCPGCQHRMHADL